MKKRNKKSSAPVITEEAQDAEPVVSPAETEPVQEEIPQTPVEETKPEETDTGLSDAQTNELPEADPQEPFQIVEEDELEIDGEEDDAAEEPAKKKDSALASVLRITLPLTIICVVVALMLAVVNLLTADTIREHAAQEKENAVRAIFTDAESIVSLEGSGDEEIFLVTRGTEILGSCIGLSENGFGGAISMMIGLDPQGSVCGVRIVSMSETPGFGTRAKNDSFLAGFRGGDPFVIGQNFDALSGATITSKAVVAGVNRAMTLQPDLAAEAQQRGLTVVIAAEEPEDIPQQTPEETAPAENPEQEAETEPADTENVVELPASPAETSPVEEEIPVSVINLAAILPTVSFSGRSASVNRVTVASTETVYVEETTEPTETEAVEPEPVETEPVETEPVETEPVETEPVETEPVEPEPVETEPVETEPVETEPVETEPVETEPVETEPVETEPAETEPAETEPVETEPAETRPVSSGV